MACMDEAKYSCSHHEWLQRRIENSARIYSVHWGILILGFSPTKDMFNAVRLF